MCFDSPDPPQVPNPFEVARQQQQYNTQAGIQSQAGSNVNQVTPFGSLTYQQTGVGPNGVPTYTATQNLSPINQMLLNIMQMGQGYAGLGAQGQLFNSGYGRGDAAATIGDATSGNTKALMDLQTSYLQPYFKNQTDQLDTKLRNQGLMPGTPAYDQQMNQLGLTQNQSVSGFLAQAQPQAYQQALQNYQLPAQLAAQLMAMGQPSGLGLTNTPGLNINPADLTGAVNSANQANAAAYNAQMQQQNSMLGGLAGIGGALITKFSDRRAKQDIAQIGTMFDGTPIYRYRYIHAPQDWHIGLMAQDVKERVPEAVIDLNGALVVDYFKATEGAVSHG